MKNLICLINLLLLINFIGIQQIKAQNEINTDKVIIDGKTYYLHVVKQGEGFYGIAKKYGVSQKEIHEANPKVLFGLKPGDVINIPVISGRNSSVNEISDSNDFLYHTIEKGQTLYFLSRKYNVSVEDIKKYNVGAESNLIVGSIIKIPIPKERDIVKTGNTAYKYHQVNPKETLYGISQKYHTQITDIIKHNPALKSGILKIGSTLRIPVSEVKKQEPEKVEAKEQIEDDKYLYHKIKAGDTFFSLVKKYNLKKGVLEIENPNLNPDDLKLGYLVRVPKNEINKIQTNANQQPFYTIHTVKKKETVYLISRKYNVDIESISKANPTLILKNIRKGTKLKVPTPAYFAHIKRLEEEAKAREAKARKLREFNMDTIQHDCSEYSFLSSEEEVKIALLLPFNVEATREHNVIKKIEEGEEVEVEKEIKDLSFKSRSFVEFYEGVLLSLDSMKNKGINITLYTYDTAHDTSKVKQILENKELKSVDFIIGPAYSSNLKLVSDFSYRHGIKMIYPLSGSNEEIERNPFVIHINTPDTLLYNEYAKYIASKSDTAKIVVLKTAEPNREEQLLCKEIKDLLYIKNMAMGKMPDYEEIIFSERDIQGISSIMSKEKSNVIIVPSPNEADVSKIITTLHGVIETSEIKINLIGFGSWLRFQTIEAENIHELNTDILTQYCIDYKDDDVNDFIKKYRSKYFTEPYAVAPYFVRPDRNSKFSKYGIWGYDVAQYFINARIKYGKSFEYCLPEFESKQIMFDFNFNRLANWGGFYNTGMHVLKFTEDFDIYRSPVNINQ